MEHAALYTPFAMSLRETRVGVTIDRKQPTRGGAVEKVGKVQNETLSIKWGPR